MPTQVTAMITFILHENLEEELNEIDQGSFNQTIKEYIKGSMEDERIGAAKYSSVEIDGLVVEIKDE